MTSDCVCIRITAALYEMLDQQLQGSAVVKVKIFDLDGRTIFSTEAAQIGADKHDYPGFLTARAGDVTTTLGHRETFAALPQASSGAIADDAGTTRTKRETLESGARRGRRRPRDQ